MPSAIQLANASAFGLVICLGGYQYVTSRFQKAMLACGYTTKSMDILKEYGPAQEALGEPMQMIRINLRSNFTEVDGIKSRMEYHVEGPKNKAILYSWCSRKRIEDEWEVDQLDLQMVKGRRFTFYKSRPTETTPENTSDISDNLKQQTKR